MENWSKHLLNRHHNPALPVANTRKKTLKRRISKKILIGNLYLKINMHSDFKKNKLVNNYFFLNLIISTKIKRNL